MTERIGIFGGTFDPPHLGHLIFASESRTQLKLTRLLWVLTPNSPHKTDQHKQDLAHRIEMVQRTIAGHPNFELSTVEFERPAPQYTVDTLHVLQKQNPFANLILLLGADSLTSLATWHHPADLVAACREIGVMRRPGESTDLDALEVELQGLKTKVRFVDAPLLEISSRDIRRRIAERREFRHFLPAAVYDYIQAHDLYID